MEVEPIGKSLNINHRGGLGSLLKTIYLRSETCLLFETIVQLRILI